MRASVGGAPPVWVWNQLRNKGAITEVEDGVCGREEPSVRAQGPADKPHSSREPSGQGHPWRAEGASPLWEFLSRAGPAAPPQGWDLLEAPGREEKLCPPQLYDRLSFQKRNQYIFQLTQEGKGHTDKSGIPGGHVSLLQPVLIDPGDPRTPLCLVHTPLSSPYFAWRGSPSHAVLPPDICAGPSAHMQGERGTLAAKLRLPQGGQKAMGTPGTP